MADINDLERQLATARAGLATERANGGEPLSCAVIEGIIADLERQRERELARLGAVLQYRGRTYAEPAGTA